jgi:hypothetical protein
MNVCIHIINTLTYSHERYQRERNKTESLDFLTMRTARDLAGTLCP